MNLRDMIRLVEGTQVVIAYHGAPSPIRGAFRAGTHFGTLAAAKQRVAELFDLPEESRPDDVLLGDPVCYQVEIRFAKPMELSDPGEWFDEAVVEDMIARGYIEPESAKDVEQDVWGWLLRNGYDCITYVNGHEDAGSTSYMPLKDHLIRVIDSFPLDQP